MSKLFSTADAAAELGVSLRAVQRASLNHDIGTKVGKSTVLTADDVETLRGLVRGVPGNPTFSDSDAQRERQVKGVAARRKNAKKTKRKSID